METNKFWGSNDVGIGMLHIRCTKCLTVRGHLTYDLMISQLCLFSYFQTGWVIRFFSLLFKVIKVKLKYVLVIVSVRLRECSVSISKPHRDYGNTFVCECVTVCLCLTGPTFILLALSGLRHQSMIRPALLHTCISTNIHTRWFFYIYEGTNWQSNLS